MDSYINRIIAIIIDKTGVEPEEINESSYFEDDLNVGEIELMDILGAVEEEYKVEFDEEEKEKIESIVDVAELVVEKIE